MASVENLKQQLKDLLILNHGDIKITEYPNLVSDGRDLGFNLGQLNQLIQQVYSEIDWRPYEIIDGKLEIIFRKGIISTAQFEEIISLASDTVNKNVVEQYVISEISKRGFKPRETNHPNALSIENKWMKDLVWEEYKQSLIEVEWLGEKANSLSKLGEISFNNKEDAKYFLRNGNYLPALVTALTKSASRADEFARIIAEEFESETRYIRILYRLNPRLPFRFEGDTYTDVAVLLRSACLTSNGYQTLLEFYRKGLLQIWIQESDPVAALNLSTEYNLNNFLRFLYKTDSTLPFYRGNHRFLTPEELVDYARNNFSIWPDIAQSIAAKNINEWFAAIGKEDWNDQIENSYSYISHTGYYSESETNLGIVQALFHITDPLSEKPRLKIDQEKIQLLSVHGGITLNHSILISLKNQGYIKVKVYFKFSKEGISLSEDIFELNSLDGKTSKEVNVIIDTLMLKKEQLYDLEFIITSVYEEIIVPVEIKVIFPKKAYLLKLAQYGLISACFFGVIRYILGLFLNYNGWFVNSGPIGNSSDMINKSPLLSFFVFVVFILGCIFSFKLVKKFEKI